jgi:hypothetical protein
LSLAVTPRTTLLLRSLVAGLALAATRPALADSKVARPEQSLLDRFNPVLVIYPQDTSRQRPGEAVLGRPGKNGFGDYHPISVDSFLDRGTLRPREKGWQAWKSVLKSLTGVRWEATPPTGAEVAKRMIAATSTEGHEIGLGAVRAQGDDTAWTYLSRELRQPTGGPLDKPVVYGRVKELADGGKILQYYYLYLYNDFINNHEADWEMASIRLDPHGKPVEMGLSSHHGGTKLAWQQVPLDASGRPLAYVATGSHAMYFAYRPDGHPLVDLGNLGINGTFRKWYLKLAPWKRFRDHVPGDPVRDPQVEASRTGTRLDSVEVRPLPKWAYDYKGTWGGAADVKPNFEGVGIKGPWATTDSRWQNPDQWMKELRPGDKDPPRFHERMRTRIKRSARKILRRAP